MTDLPAALNALPPRSVRTRALGNIVCLMLLLGLVDATAGGPFAFAQNIQFTPSAVSLTVPQGGTGTATLSLKKSDTAQHTYFISANQSWIWLNPPYGSTQTISTETDVLTVTVNAASMGLSAGSYSGTIYIGQSGPGVSTTWRIPVTATVTAAGSTPPPPPPSTTPPPPPVNYTAAAPAFDAAAASGDPAAPAPKRLLDAHDPGLSGGLVAGGPERRHCVWNLQPAKVQLRSKAVTASVRINPGPLSIRPMEARKRLRAKSTPSQ